jgi:hypothetical protein
MRKLPFVFLVFFAALFTSSSVIDAKYKRSVKVLKDFQKLNPCPSTGQREGPCPGYIKDHVKPLVCGGADTVENLQWQTVADAKAKDRLEMSCCKRGAMIAHPLGGP